MRVALQRFFLVIFGLFIGFCCFFGLELYVRWSKPTVEALDLFVPGKGQGDHAGEEAVYEGDPLLGWRLRANLKQAWWDFTVFDTNNRHLRGKNHGPKKPGSIRIICLGDSVTFGYRVPVSFRDNPDSYNREDKPYPEVLEELLEEKFPNQDFEVINMAVPGYSSFHGKTWLAWEGRDYQPDLIVANFGFNDTLQKTTEWKDAFPTHPRSVFARWLLSQSQLLIYLRQKYFLEEKKEEKPAPTKAVVSPDDYLENFRNMDKTAREMGARFIAIGQVFREVSSEDTRDKLMVKNRARLKSDLPKYGIHYFEIPELMETTYPENKALFGEKIHPNAPGLKLMAERVLEYIENNGIFDERLSRESK